MVVVVVVAASRFRDAVCNSEASLGVVRHCDWPLPAICIGPCVRMRVCVYVCACVTQEKTSKAMPSTPVSLRPQSSTKAAVTCR